jgi:hypothetical protein
MEAERATQHRRTGCGAERLCGSVLIGLGVRPALEQH